MCIIINESYIIYHLAIYSYSIKSQFISLVKIKGQTVSIYFTVLWCLNENKRGFQSNQLAHLILKFEVEVTLMCWYIMSLFRLSISLTRNSLFINADKNAFYRLKYSIIISRERLYKIISTEHAKSQAPSPEVWLHCNKYFIIYLLLLYLNDTF